MVREGYDTVFTHNINAESITGGPLIIKLMCFSLSPYPCVRRIVIATCRPSPFRCRLNCSWTARWPTHTITCTRTWRRTRPTWCFPLRHLGCPWRHSRRNPRLLHPWWRRLQRPKTTTRTPASRTWDWRPKSTRPRLDCDMRYARNMSCATDWRPPEAQNIAASSVQNYTQTRTLFMFLEGQTSIGQLQG